eukprot:Nk52_evm80s1444 gene=Nk52_evmTU80s1444
MGRSRESKRVNSEGGIGKGKKKEHSPSGRPLGVTDARYAKLATLHKKLRFDQPEYIGPLEVVDLFPEKPDFVLVIHNFLSTFECKQLINVIEDIQLNKASGKDTHPKRGEAYLDRENLPFKDPLLADTLWQRLKDHLPLVDGRKPVCFQDKLSYYCYRKGQRFDEHVDQSSRSVDNSCQTEYTLLIYLNGGVGSSINLEGGETEFMGSKGRVALSVEPEEGMLLLHAHGQRCLLHAGREVRKGVKYVFRTDIMYDRNK